MDDAGNLIADTKLSTDWQKDSDGNTFIRIGQKFVLENGMTWADLDNAQTYVCYEGNYCIIWAYNNNPNPDVDDAPSGFTMWQTQNGMSPDTDLTPYERINWSGQTLEFSFDVDQDRTELKTEHYLGSSISKVTATNALASYSVGEVFPTVMGAWYSRNGGTALAPYPQQVNAVFGDYSSTSGAAALTTFSAAVAAISALSF